MKFEKIGNKWERLSFSNKYNYCFIKSAAIMSNESEIFIFGGENIGKYEKYPYIRIFKIHNFKMNELNIKLPKCYLNSSRPVLYEESILIINTMKKPSILKLKLDTLHYENLDIDF